MGNWDDLLSRIEIILQDDEHKRPTIGDLDGFEAEFGFKLPEDYRQFALRFGPGELGRREWRFQTPGFPGAGPLADLGELNRGYLRRLQGIETLDEAKFSRYGDPMVIRRLVTFCTGGLETDAFTWDTGHVTDPEKNDYAVYILSGDLEPHVQRVASSFREFVVDYLLAGGYDRHVYEPSTEPYELEGRDEILFVQPSLSGSED
jgi:hypothetical protein